MYIRILAVFSSLLLFFSLSSNIMVSSFAYDDPTVIGKIPKSIQQNESETFEKIKQAAQEAKKKIEQSSSSVKQENKTAENANQKPASASKGDGKQTGETSDVMQKAMAAEKELREKINQEKSASKDKFKKEPVQAPKTTNSKVIVDKKTGRVSSSYQDSDHATRK